MVDLEFHDFAILFPWVLNPRITDAPCRLPWLDVRHDCQDTIIFRLLVAVAWMSRLDVNLICIAKRLRRRPPGVPMWQWRQSRPVSSFWNPTFIQGLLFFSLPLLGVGGFAVEVDWFVPAVAPVIDPLSLSADDPIVVTLEWCELHTLAFPTMMFLRALSPPLLHAVPVHWARHVIEDLMQLYRSIDVHHVPQPCHVATARGPIDAADVEIPTEPVPTVGAVEPQRSWTQAFQTTPVF